MQNQAYVSRLEEKGIEFKSVKVEKIQDLQKVKDEMMYDRILIVNITHLLGKSMEQAEYALRELHSYCLDEGYSLARMGQNRVLVLPPYVRF